MNWLVIGLLILLGILFLALVAFAVWAVSCDSRVEPDGNDKYRIAVAEHVMRTGKPCLGHVDEKGNLVIEEIK